MTEGKPLPIMLRFAGPLILTNTLQLFYTLADSAILGRLAGVDAFAAVGATASLYWMILSAVIGISHGFGTVVAQRYGARDEQGLREAVTSAGFCTLVIGLIIAAGGLLAGRVALMQLNTPVELMEGAALYLHFLLAGMPVTFMNLLAGAILRAMGDSKTPLTAMIFSTLLNIALDFAMVIPFGIAGVAAATLLSQLAACVFCFVILTRGGTDAVRLQKDGITLRRNAGWSTGLTLRVRLTDIRFNMVGELLRIALPLGFRNAVIEVGGLFVQYYINGYGAVYVAGVAAAKRMYSLLTLAGGAMEATVATFVAQNLGAGMAQSRSSEISNNTHTHDGFNHLTDKYAERINDGVRIGFWLMLGSSLVIAALSILFGRQLLSLLISGDASRITAVLDAGQQQLFVIAAGLPVLYMLFLYRSALQGLGRTFVPMLSGFLELAGRFAAVFALAPVLGIWGVYSADAAGWVGAALAVFIAYRTVRR
jgi:putative MATE family efflux protein